MRTHRLLHALGICALLFLPGVGAQSLDPAAAGADPLHVEPRVPRAAGTPCVVTLMRDERMPVNSIFGTNFSYAPPAGCPGAWAKVKLVIELEGPRENGNPVSALSLVLSETSDPTNGVGAALWAGAPQMTDDVPTWRVERDVTEYARLLRQPHFGLLSGRYDNVNYDFADELRTPLATALLVFYPATTQTPAQRVADLVLPVSSFSPHGHEPIAAYTGAFPRNIERAYLDVVSHVSAAGGGVARYWWACSPDDVLTEFPYLRNSFAIGDARSNVVSHMQGCGGGSYREVEVRIDGRLAGLAPVFPWLGSSISNTFRNTVDTPAPAAQALNWMPFRVDLTPFAGLLNNGAEHTVEARLVGAADGLVSGHLVLYRDRNRTIVPGAVTSNTLAEATPNVTDTLAETTSTNSEGEVTRHLTGEVATRSVRSFRITGYVDTSRGRITSTVQQRNYFLNRNLYDVTATGVVALWEFFRAIHDQKVRMTSAVDVTSRRVLGTTLLSEDKSYTAYPFTVDYRQGGEHRSEDEFSVAIPDHFMTLVHQARVQRSSQYRRGTPTRYETSLVDVFDGTREWTEAAGTFNWGSARDYRFTDNRGGCYSASLTTMDGLLQTRTRGDDCPNGTNALRWWSHPDGSPDAMNWAPAP